MKQVKHRSAKSGQYITVEAVAENPDGTITETDSTLTRFERAVIDAAREFRAKWSGHDDCHYVSELQAAVDALNEAEQDQR